MQLLESTTAQYAAMQARLVEVEGQLAAQAGELQSLRAEKEMLAEAAAERLEALEVNSAAVTALKAELSKYQ